MTSLLNEFNLLIPFQPLQLLSANLVANIIQDLLRNDLIQSDVKAEIKKISGL